MEIPARSCEDGGLSAGMKDHERRAPIVFDSNDRTSTRTCYDDTRKEKTPRKTTVHEFSDDSDSHMDSDDGKPKAKRTKPTIAVPDISQNTQDVAFCSIGFKFHKKFGTYGWFEGEVVKIIDEAEYENVTYKNMRHVQYNDGDEEDLTLSEIQMAIRSYKDFLKRKDVKSKDDTLVKYTYSVDEDLFSDEDEPNQESVGWTGAASTAAPTGVGGLATQAVVTPIGGGLWKSNRCGGWGAQGVTTTTFVTPTAGGWGTQAGTSSTFGTLPLGSRWGTVARSTIPTDASTGGTTMYRTPTTKREGKICLSDFAIQSKGVLLVCRESRDEFFLRHQFGERLHIIESPASLASSMLDKERTFNGEQCILIASKFDKGSNSKVPNYSICSKMVGPHIKAFYVSGTTKSVEEELNKIANFAELGLDPGKIAARLELLVSPAHRGSKGALQFELPLTTFREVNSPENKTMGCGFIPTRLLQKLLGNAILDAFAIQIRVISAHLGIFKGMLIAKNGITEIQLPQSMKKVIGLEKSKSPEKAYLIIKNIFPTKKQSNHERVINPNFKRPPTKDATMKLEGLNESVSKILLGCGVSKVNLQNYNEGQNMKDWEQRRHEYLIGVSDCTKSGLPEGTVFITGLGLGTERKMVIVTRFPCTEMEDMLVVPVVSVKPPTMSDNDWNHLCALGFGAIMFASPSDASTKSLPEQINNSDLDGDYFCVIWETEIVSQFQDFRRKETTRLNEIINCQAHDTFEDSDESEDEDDLIGTLVPVSVSGKYCEGVVAGKRGKDKYIVKFGEHEEELSHDTICQDKQYVKEILNHRGKGRKAEIQLRWDNGWVTWQELDLMKQQIPDIVADYARASNLLNEPGWKWAKVYIREAEIVSITSHRFVDNTGIEVEVQYDGEVGTEWTNAKTIDVDLLAKYVDEKNITLEDTNCEEWEWLRIEIAEAKKNWFKPAQDRIADAVYMTEFDRFVKNLFALWNKREDIHHPDTIALGRAYKKALTLGKHGGRVAIPEHLRKLVASKPDSFANVFIKIKGQSDK